MKLEAETDEVAARDFLKLLVLNFKLHNSPGLSFLEGVTKPFLLTQSREGEVTNEELELASRFQKLLLRASSCHIDTAL